jgi:hypothetical protein
MDNTHPRNNNNNNTLSDTGGGGEGAAALSLASMARVFLGETAIAAATLSSVTPSAAASAAVV